MDSKQILEGGCHCAAVRWRAKVDLGQGTTRCNCSFCTKAGWWAAQLAPADFELVSGQDALADYQHGARATHLFFCKACGVRSFSRGDAPWMGGAYVAINLNCLDDQAALAGLPVRWFDGRHDSWENFRDEVSSPRWP